MHEDKPKHFTSLVVRPFNHVDAGNDVAIEEMIEYVTNLLTGDVGYSARNANRKRIGTHIMGIVTLFIF